ncbi:hypothetical protein B0T19DRAFT_421748 [Cercophora scortea]|uniref:Uncharacterized protein n=1 Tax=Cercophora scortea TaxID=314031 RepID=A0AAE0MCF5_9PEZI|nr:hypothetical protein B0T19DRAFT_421748 [Cercophora scortea]
MGWWLACVYVFLVSLAEKGAGWLVDIGFFFLWSLSIPPTILAPFLLAVSISQTNLHTHTFFCCRQKNQTLSLLAIRQYLRIHHPSILPGIGPS